jgi:two-component system sensor histidine kinase SenX3
MGLINNRSLAVPELVAIVDEVRRSGEPVYQELELARKSGDYYWVDVRAALASNGNVVLLLEDNTEGHRLDDARRDFIANISHELKTPIGAIGLLAEALVGATDDPETVRKFSKNLLKESRRLADLVQDIIQLSRVQSNEVLRKATPVRISDIIAEATERCAILAESQKISITVECPESEYVVGDSELLIVAVKNLIDNAIQYSEPKKRVGIGVNATENSVQIAVADAGMGIPQDEQARIFERFYRVDASRSRQTGGTGLGLSLVKHIALSHGGEVTLFSQVGIGSTFTIRLPRFDPAQLEALS